MIGSLAHDVRAAARALLRSPGFLAVALATMAAGIGASTAIFSAVNAVLLRPLPYPQPERLVAVHSRVLRGGTSNDTVSYPDLRDWRAESRTLSALAAYYATGVVIAGSEAERVRAARVTPDFFDVLGAVPARGTLLPAEARDQPLAVAVLSHGLWERRLGGRDAVVGSTLVLNGRPFVVAGVLPPSFRPPPDLDRTEVYLPLSLDQGNLEERGNRYLSAIGRLRPPATSVEADAELGAVSERLAAAFPEENGSRGVSVRPLQEHLVSAARRPLAVLMAAVAFVLLIAGINVAHLLLPRALARRREVAIRMALGAGRGRIVRELLAEVLLLWTLGAALGATVAGWAVRLLVTLAPPDTPRLAEVALDGRVLLFALGSALFTGLAFGLWPALAATRVAPADSLREGGRAVGLARRRATGALVVGEMALALVLLMGAGLALGSLRRLVSEPPGFDAEGVMTAELSLLAAAYPNGPAREAFYTELLERLRGLPGVSGAALVTPLPLSGDTLRAVVTLPDRPLPPGRRPHVVYHAVSPDYFTVMRIPVLRGRGTADTDRRGGAAVAVVSATAAGRLFPGQDPLGQRFQMGITPDGDSPTQFEVVGVVGDVHHETLREAPEADVYVARAQHAWGWATMVLRTPGDPAPLAAAVRREVARLDGTQAITATQTMRERVAGSLGLARFTATLLSLFAAVAVLMAAVGLYGVLATLVAQRTPEIGLRMAMGAGVGDVLRLVVGRAARLAAVGVGLGALAAAALGRSMSALLFRVAPTDPATLALVAGTLFTVALAASVRPAWRAAHIDPAAALREE
jgi:putative ABC transport system permease protein